MEERGGVTRDPFHPHARNKRTPKGNLPGIFTPNFYLLEFLLDGNKLKTSEVHSAFPDQNEIWLFARDENGEIIAKSQTEPETVKVNGKVEVIGDCTGCTPCAVGGRKVPKWWKRQNW